MVRVFDKRKLCRCVDSVVPSAGIILSNGGRPELVRYSATRSDFTYVVIEVKYSSERKRAQTEGNGFPFLDALGFGLTGALFGGLMVTGAAAELGLLGLAAIGAGSLALGLKAGRWLDETFDVGTQVFGKGALSGAAAAVWWDSHGWSTVQGALDVVQLVAFAKNLAKFSKNIPKLYQFGRGAVRELIVVGKLDTVRANRLAWEALERGQQARLSSRLGQSIRNLQLEERMYTGSIMLKQFLPARLTVLRAATSAVSKAVCDVFGLPGQVGSSYTLSVAVLQAAGRHQR